MFLTVFTTYFHTIQVLILEPELPGVPLTLLIFGKSVQPISTRGTVYSHWHPKTISPSGFPVFASLNRKYIHYTYFVNWYLVAIFGNQATIRFLQIQIRAQIIIQAQWIAILQITTHFEEEILTE